MWGFTRNCHPEFISGSTPLVIIQNKEEMLKQVQHDNRRGFTLIELLVVVLIIGILAAVAVPQYKKAMVKSRASSVLPVLKTISEAVEMFWGNNGKFPSSLEELDIELSNSTYVKTPSSYSYSCYIYHTDWHICVGNPVSAHYCPKNTSGYWSCRNFQDFSITFVSPRAKSANKGKRICKSTNNLNRPTALGEAACNALFASGVVDVWEKPKD